MRSIVKKTMLLLILTLCLSGVFSITQNVKAATNYWAEPATVTKVTDQTLTQLIDPRANGSTEISERINGTFLSYTPQRETYNPIDRQWQGLPSVAKVGDRLWATWYTGGTGEPRQFNYLVIAYSDDDGETWVDPFLIVDHQDPNSDGVSLGVPNLYVDESGKLCLIWIQYYTWILRFDNAGTENITDVTWQTPEVLTTSKIHKAPTYFKDQDGMQAMMIASEAEASDKHIITTRFYVSKDAGESWQLRSNLLSSAPNNRVFPESQIVQLANDSLMVLSRIESGTAGGIEKAVSTDYGYNFDAYENNLDVPYIGPGSKFHVMKLTSGNLLIINHNTTSSRSGLVAYLSLDNGETFPYSLTIDERTDVSYPCAFQDGDDIYVTWDKGRYLQKEIRYAVITEADIMQGTYQSENAVQLGIISKLASEYTEIISVNDAFQNKLTFKTGTESNAIRNDLPTTFTVTDSSGNDIEVTGTWKNPGYYQDVPGTYEFYFQTNLPLKVEDTYNLLSISVTLEPDTETNSHALTYITIGIGVVIIAVGTVFIIKRKH